PTAAKPNVPPADMVPRWPTEPTTWPARHGGQQSQQPGQRATDAAWFYAQQIQQGATFVVAWRTPVTRHCRVQASAARQPGDVPCVLAAHRLAAWRTHRRHAMRGSGNGGDLALQ